MRSELWALLLKSDASACSISKARVRSVHQRHAEISAFRQAAAVAIENAVCTRRSDQRARLEARSSWRAASRARAATEPPETVERHRAAARFEPRARLAATCTTPHTDAGSLSWPSRRVGQGSSGSLYGA